VKPGGADAIRQIRLAGPMEPEQIAQFPWPSDKPTLKAQIRNGEGVPSPWVYARVVWLKADGEDALGRPLIDIALSLDPPPPNRTEPRIQRAQHAHAGRAKLTQEQLEARNLAIREDRRGGLKHKELRAKYGLSLYMIGVILDGLKPDRSTEQETR
jgi:hypothetical protein